MAQPDQYERAVSGALLCLSDRYTSALMSGGIAMKSNVLNLESTSPELEPMSMRRATKDLRQPLDFGVILLTETQYVHPIRQVWVHGELHINFSVDFGDDVHFSMDEKIRGDGQEVLGWRMDFVARISAWCQGKGGYFKVMQRQVEIEEKEYFIGGAPED